MSEPPGPAHHREKPDYRHGISLLHELKYPRDFEHFEYADPHAPKGGKTTLSTPLHVSNFNQVPGSGMPTAAGLGQTVDRLLIRSADELSGLYGLLVQGVALSRDKRTLFLHLHPDARWHDGVPITAADVKFSYDELLETVFGKVYFETWVESLDVIGPRELAVHHRNTFANSNLVALTWFPVRPAHYWKDRDTTKPTLEPPVGSGPYRIAEFGRSFIRYERVKDYWARDLPVNRGRYNFDEIRYEVYRDATVAREGLRKGLFDFYVEGEIRHWFGSYDVPALHEGRLIQNTRDVRKFIGAQVSIALNTDRERLRDVRVREALALALDFEWQNRVFLGNSQTRSLSYFANSRFAATGMPSDRELTLLREFAEGLPTRTLGEPFAMPVSTGIGLNRAALERALSLLEDAGWQVQGGVLQDGRGNPFQLEILTQNRALQRILLPYIESLQLLGIDARLRLMDNVAVVNQLRARDYDAHVRAHEALNPPIGELRNYFGSRSADIELSGNRAGIRDPVVDALIERAERAPNLEALIAACRALDRVLLWGFYNILINVPDLERFLYWDKFGRPSGEAVARYEHLVGSSVRVFDSWWIDADKARRLSSSLGIE